MSKFPWTDMKVRFHFWNYANDPKFKSGLNNIEFDDVSNWLRGHTFKFEASITTTRVNTSGGHHRLFITKDGEGRL